MLDAQVRAVIRVFDPHGVLSGLVDRDYLTEREATDFGYGILARWYLRFGLSYRDVEELLADRGIEVDHVTVYRWVQRFAPEFAEAARARQHVIGDRWHVDETYVKVGGTWRYVFRAIDQFGQVIDVFLSLRRDAGAGRRFFTQAIDRTRISPVEVTTDRYRVYPRVLDELLPAADHDLEPGRGFVDLALAFVQPVGLKDQGVALERYDLGGSAHPAGSCWIVELPREGIVGSSSRITTC